MTFFGGEPLLNLPVLYYLAERMWHATRDRGVEMSISIISNGLLLTPDVATPSAGGCRRTSGSETGTASRTSGAWGSSRS